jgi:hypothetical protein
MKIRLNRGSVRGSMIFFRRRIPEVALVREPEAGILTV